MAALAELPVTPFAEWLAALLRERGLNRSQLAAYVGAAPQTVSSWFTDDRIPKPPLCMALARVLHLDPAEVLRLAGHLPPLAEEPPPPVIDPEVAAELARLSPEEQRRWALPAVRLAVELHAQSAGDDAPAGDPEEGNRPRRPPRGPRR